MSRKPEMGKFLLYRFFYNNHIVRGYLPDTRRYSVDNLRSCLSRYGSVYLKPCGGQQGKGIMRVWRAEGRVQVKKTIHAMKSFRTVEQAAAFIDRMRDGKAYIVQRTIDLATVHGRPFDVRVMTQRERPGGEWKYSGMLAKVAGPGSVVTNVAMSKGSVLGVEDALKQSFGWKQRRIRQCTDELIRVSLIASKHFDNYQFYRELGFDLAIDKSGRVWMIEQNTAPSHPLFRRLTSNLSMYRRIQFRWWQFEQARRSKKAH